MVERLFWLDTSVSNNSLRVTTQIVQEIQKFQSSHADLVLLQGETSF